MSPCPPACGTSLSFQLLTSQISIPTRDPSGPFLMSVDHCFSIKGQGTVMTGTILSGSVSLGDSVEIQPPCAPAAGPGCPVFPLSVPPAAWNQGSPRCSEQRCRLEPRGQGFSVKVGGPWEHGP